MNQPEEDNQNSFKSAVTITVIGVAVITFVVIFVALFAGLWLDKLLNSRPIFTIVLVIISIPVTILLMLRLVKVATNRIKPTQTKSSIEESHRGTDS
jgi:F0F1-type ATP synthase assembly protein I